jgi:hypothetical protein
MTDLAAKNPTVGFVIRPHFRLLPSIEGSGPAGARLVRDFREDLKRLRNVHLDEDRDYRPALRVADAMAAFIRQLREGTLPQPRPRPSALCSGRRVVAAMLGDWTQEVFDA